MLRPQYAVLALTWAFLTLGILLWVFNLNLLGYIFSNTTLSIGEKILFVLQGYASVFTNFDSLGAATLLVFSILLGINFALLLFVLRAAGASVKRESGKGGLSLAAAILGAGCAACGTSILAPLLTAAGATSTITLVRTIGVLANTVGIGLVLFSIYGLGKQAATELTKNT